VPAARTLLKDKNTTLEETLPKEFHCAPIHSANLTFAFLGANHRFTIFTLYIDCGCLDHGLLEHRIETTSEVVSILIG